METYRRREVIIAEPCQIDHVYTLQSEKKSAATNLSTAHYPKSRYTHLLPI